MSAVKANWCQLPAQGAVQVAATNIPGDRFATSSIEDGTAYVQVWEPDASAGDWSLISQLEVSSQVTQLAWADPEAGPLVAGASSNGSIRVWEAPRPGTRGASGGPDDMADDASPSAADEDDEGREWFQSGEMQAGTAPISQLCFAPRQFGLLLAAASEDGHIYIFEADRPLAPNGWTLQGKLQVCGAKSLAQAGCTCMSWRGFNAGVPPLLAAGATAGVDIWQYDSALMVWQRVSSLKPSGPGPIASTHWAPALGRPVDLVAAAHGHTVDVFTLQGDSGALQTELVASLSHDSEVWKVEFNRLGTCLAAATDSNNLHLWKPNFIGEWQLVGVVQGSEEVAVGAEEADDEGDALVD